MPLLLPRSTFLMVPRAASTWCRQAIRNGGIPYREFGPKHSTALPPEAPTFRFCLTREPRAWVKSRWVLGAWEDELSQIWTLDRSDFASKVTDAMVGMYFAKWVNLCKPTGFVGTAENAADDLVTALRMAGEDFDETALRDTPRVNESPPDGDLEGSALWSLKRDQLGQLPADAISRLPIELIPKLPPGKLETLPPDIMASTVKRLAQAAMESAGASVTPMKR